MLPTDRPPPCRAALSAKTLLLIRAWPEIAKPPPLVPAILAVKVLSVHLDDRSLHRLKTRGGCRTGGIGNTAAGSRGAPGRAGRADTLVPRESITNEVNDVLRPQATTAARIGLVAIKDNIGAVKHTHASHTTTATAAGVPGREAAA